jgi:UDP-2,4-diacetamido-2,4,6-trideoxy-beta-L-altropyranose hydrolase/pseudaminic acid synthase
MNILVLEQLEQVPELTADVVTTSANGRLNELREYAATHERVNLHIDSENIGKLMSAADFGVITASVSANEAVFMGLPFVAVKVAENQLEIYNYLRTKGFLCVEKDGIERLPELVRQLSADRSRYEEITTNVAESGI